MRIFYSFVHNYSLTLCCVQRRVSC